MNGIYHWIGLTVFWVIALGVAVAVACYIWDGLLVVWRSNYFAFYIKRKTFPADWLRDKYTFLHRSKSWSRWVFKYRLRNIKRARK